MEYKPGSVIEIKEEGLKRAIDVARKEREDAAAIIDHAARKDRRSQESIWESIEAVYPGITDYSVMLSYKEHKIVVKYKLGEGEK